MNTLRQKARELLESGRVQVVIGYGPGSEPSRRRPTFVRTPAQADALVFDEQCRQNLATYLMKPEVRALGKAAVVARHATLRTLLQYATENQLVDGLVLALVPADSGVDELGTFAAIEEHLATQPHGLTADELAEVRKFAERPLTERWAFWQAEMSRCIKCYACRAACPLCYCSRCITEVNQPQWIPVESDPLGNLDWNVVRAMHLAGRCVDCGSCSDACPQDIRLDLLNRTLADEARTRFGAEPGYSVRKDYALAAYRPDDKEDFIK
jgi:ferredoxin